VLSEVIPSREETPGDVESRLAAGHSNHRTSKALEPLLAYLRGLGAAPPEPAPVAEGPVEELLWRYRRYLTVERGLTPETSRGYVDAVRPFLAGRLSAEGLDLERLRPADVTAFVVARCPRQARGAAKLTVTALRSLLGFLHLKGEVGQPLTQAVPSVAGWRLAGLPRRLGSEEVARLLASCDRDTANGRRDFAILTALARLGLRRGEVAALALDDVDWRAGEIVVRGKGRRSERLPLPADVGEAIAASLAEVGQLLLHPSTLDALRRYLRRGDRPRQAQGTEAVLVSMAGTRLLYTNVQVAFARLRDRAGRSPGPSPSTPSPAATGRATRSSPSSRACDYADPITVISTWEAGFRDQVGITQVSA
jgi:site-specific recombinase XerC